MQPQANEKYQYSSEWIHKLENERHWQYYHFQQSLIQKHVEHKESILEVGIGSSFTYNYLKSKNYNIISMDIDADKKPDIVANIVSDDLPANIDTILAFEVFEHIPYDEYMLALKKAKDSGVKKLIISMPLNIKVWFDFDIRLHVFGRIAFQIATRRNKLTTNHHHWEIGYQKYRFNKIKQDITEQGFKIINDCRKFSQHFFVLSTE
ncbi:methyltransferase domain-containing protein [Carboxylicivirga marina]|uniref:Methyltransferase type 11 n=1 Tax=Carboxylicivirga marina TaxID=2800988 RepID=A0ABS1HLY3_9BACT|nr:hypothetical protein [Carboxylicivirga marina]MBK3518557.1 hypothetical protein [Carboxylicivirga marina]